MSEVIERKDALTGNTMAHFCIDGWIQRTREGGWAIKVCPHMDVFKVSRGRVIQLHEGTEAGG